MSKILVIASNFPKGSPVADTDPTKISSGMPIGEAALCGIPLIEGESKSVELLIENDVICPVPMSGKEARRKRRKEERKNKKIKS